jgi:uncharacterized protein (DUF4415 family)
MKGGATVRRSKKRSGVKEPGGVRYEANDEGIDLSDLPELDSVQFAKGKVRPPITKEAVSIRLDSDLLEAFRGQGPGYQTRINRALRKALALSRVHGLAGYRVYQEDGGVSVYLGTDEYLELVSTIEHCGDLAQELGDSSNWKWLILAIHNAVQCACVCALRGEDTIGLTMLTPKSGRKKLNIIEGSRTGAKAQYSDDRLDEMLKLYEKVSGPDSLNPQQRLPRLAKRDKDITRLNEFRNKFVHFVPGGWSIELSGMPRIMEHACQVIEHLALKHSTFWHHLDEARRNRIANALQHLRRGVKQWSADAGI